MKSHRVKQVLLQELMCVDQQCPDYTKKKIYKENGICQSGIEHYIVEALK